jgi:molybdate transport system ATP-binding protein
LNALQVLRAAVRARVGRFEIEVDLDTGPGTLVVVGPNGSGKTSLLSLLIGVLALDKGRVEIGGDVLFDSDRGVDVPIEDRHIGYVPQDYALFPQLTVRENVEFALASSSMRFSRRERAARVEALLRDLGIEALAERSTQGLSGGEKQRVALCRALSVSPRALLLDEPLSALDAHSRPVVRSFLAAHLQVLGLPAVVVTHDAADARLLGHRIAVLENGRMSQTGTWAELAARPASRFVEEFVASST